MISKHVPPLSGLTSLVVAIGCTIDGVTSVVLLVSISTYTKLDVTSLALGLQPRQGLANFKPNSEAHESHFMLSRV
jgi:hypothetical protein